MKVPEIETIRLFGSNARGDASNLSDYDILVVLKNRQIVSPHLKEYVESLFSHEISISWYSKDRISFLHRMGHLFAWHLFLESKCLFADSDFITILGTPTEYRYGKEDVWSLIEILKPIKEAVNKRPENLIYEAGLTYVCARNIGISAMRMIKGTFDFGTRTPYKLGLSLPMEEYEVLMACRQASSRGQNVPKLSCPVFRKMFEIIENWASEQFLQIQEMNK